MKKHINLIFSILLIVGVIGASPILLNRYNVEKENNIYQIAINSNSLAHIKDEKEIKDFFKELKKENISTLTFNNISIRDLASYRDLRYMTVGSYLEDKENFNYKIDGFIPKYAAKDNIVIMMSKEDFLDDEVKLIKEFLSNSKVIEEDNDLFFYIDEPIEVNYNGEKIPNSILTSKFFISKKGIEETYQLGMNPMLSISNSNDEDVQKILFNQIIELHDKYKMDKIQINGSEVIGYPSNISKFLDEFKKNNISIVTTEFQTSVGLNAYLENGKSNLIRGHEIPLEKLNLSTDDFAARIARAVKERNMRVIIITDYIDYRNNTTITKSINKLLDGFKKAENLLDNGYKAGIATSYKIIERHTKAEVFTSLASASIFGLLILSIFDKNKKVYTLSIVGSIIMLLFASVVNKLQINFGIKVYALFVAIMGACGAIVVPYKSKIKSYTIKFLLSGLLAIITGMLIAAIMYGTEYILKLKVFSGIKILYILPPILVALWLLVDSQILKNIFKFRLNKQQIINIVKSIRWYHIVLALLVIFGGIIYIRRSGNAGNASSFELEMRNMLEKLLYVRPRTKEFMLGYPAIFITYYMLKNNIKYAQYMLILGSIATMSTVNTFTHLHTPIIYSLLRSVYSVILGAIVGIICILIFKRIKRFIKKES